MVGPSVEKDDEAPRERNNMKKHHDRPRHPKRGED